MQFTKVNSRWLKRHLLDKAPEVQDSLQLTGAASRCRALDCPGSAPICPCMQVDGRLVGVHLSRGGNVDDVALGQMTPIQDEAGGTTGVSIHQLLQLVRMQPNRPECITSANNIARAQPVRARKRKADGLVEAEEVWSTQLSVRKPWFRKTQRLSQVEISALM